jgi:hypothetical protein
MNFVQLHAEHYPALRRLADNSGFEPVLCPRRALSWFMSRFVNPPSLKLRRVRVEDIGFEPMTPSLQS